MAVPSLPFSMSDVVTEFGLGNSLAAYAAESPDGNLPLSLSEFAGLVYIPPTGWVYVDPVPGTPGYADYHWSTYGTGDQVWVVWEGYQVFHYGNSTPDDTSTEHTYEGYYYERGTHQNTFDVVGHAYSVQRTSLYTEYYDRGTYHWLHDEFDDSCYLKWNGANVGTATVDDHGVTYGGYRYFKGAYMVRMAVEERYFKISRVAI